MYLQGKLFDTLGQLDDSQWQSLLARHAFWRAEGSRLDAEHDDIAFHILLSEGEIADNSTARPLIAAAEFDAVAVDPSVLSEPNLRDLVLQWSNMHSENYGAGITTKMGLYVIRSGGILGYHIDGPVFLKGQRVDLSVPSTQRGIVELHASHRTILPLRFNQEDQFSICGFNVPMKRQNLFEFSNVLPHAYTNLGSEHAVLLVTTYLAESALPSELSYA